MRRLTVLLALTFSVMFSSPSFAEWTKVAENVDGDTYYVDFSTIKKNGGYVYYWRVRDYLKPDPFGDLSNKHLYELDCNIPIKERSLSATYHTEPMGKGPPSATDNTTSEWYYWTPNSVGGYRVERVCAYTN